MTYGEFKTELDSVLYADTKAPSDDAVLIPMVMMEMRAIAYLCKPLALVVTSPDFRIIRALGDGYYLRESALIRDSLSKIDLDKELIDALLYKVAAKISKRNKEDYESSATSIIASFNFKILEAENNADE